MKKFRKSDYCKPLEECSREEDEDGVSEYVIMLAITRMKNEVFTEEELQNEVAQVICNNVLSSLVDEGLIKAAWDPEKNDIVFYPA
jgi:hypothetical protein